MMALHLSTQVSSEALNKAESAPCSKRAKSKCFASHAFAVAAEPFGVTVSLNWQQVMAILLDSRRRNPPLCAGADHAFVERGVGWDRGYDRAVLEGQQLRDVNCATWLQSVSSI